MNDVILFIICLPHWYLMYLWTVITWQIKMVKQFTLPNLSMIVLNDEVFPCSE